MSCGFSEFKSPSIPSINTSGEVEDPLPIEPIPRMLISLEAFNVPPLEEVEKFIPATVPCKASVTELTGREANSLAPTVETAPVRFTFF